MEKIKKWWDSFGKDLFGGLAIAIEFAIISLVLLLI